MRRRLVLATVGGFLVGSAMGAAAGTVLPDRAAPPAAALPGRTPPSPGPVATRTPPQAHPSGVGEARACAVRALGLLSVRDRAGQVVMAGVPATDPARAFRTVRRERLGAVFLAGRSTASPTALRRAVDELQEAAVGVRLHVAVDQEGGKVQTLRGAGFTDVPSALEQGGWPADQLAVRTGRWARPLAQAGVTLDLAPVADTVPSGTAAANRPIGAFHRQYGASAEAVAADVVVVVRALQRNGVQATVKHFPGLGRVRVNTDEGRGAEDGTATARDPHLLPFRHAISAGVGAVMVSSARYPQLDDDSIAAFSRPIITRLLRERLRFDGLVVSDDLGAAGAVREFGVGDRAVRFVAAGGDLVLTVRLEDASTMTQALERKARRSDDFAARLGDAARRVLESKARAGLLSCAAARK